MEYFFKNFKKSKFIVSPEKNNFRKFFQMWFLYFIELYANFDCELNEKFIVNSIISAFSDIVKGKYLRINQSFSDQENYELINLALKTLTSMLNSIYEICEKEQTLNKKTIGDNEIGSNNSLISLDDKDIFGHNKLDIGDTTPLNNKNIKGSCLILEKKPSDNLQELFIETNEKIDNNLKKKYELQTH